MDATWAWDNNTLSSPPSEEKRQAVWFNSDIYFIWELPADRI